MARAFRELDPTMNANSLSVPVSLRGKVIAIVGGELREPACRRLEQHFGSRVLHFESRENDASPRLFASIAGCAPDLLVWIFGRSRHAHGDYVRNLARGLGIPFLALRSFPHPHRLLAEIANRHLLGHLVGGAR